MITARTTDSECGVVGRRGSLATIHQLPQHLEYLWHIPFLTACTNDAHIVLYIRIARELEEPMGTKLRISTNSRPSRTSGA